MRSYKSQILVNISRQFLLIFFYKFGFFPEDRFIFIQIKQNASYVSYSLKKWHLTVNVSLPTKNTCSLQTKHKQIVIPGNKTQALEFFSL